MSSWFDDYGYAEVAPELLIGAVPLDAVDVGRLSHEGVDVVENLCEDAEYPPAHRRLVESALQGYGITELREPLVDFGGFEPAQLERAVSQVLAALEGDARVYLHCRAGWQRSAAVAAGVVALREDISIQDALQSVAARKPTADPLTHQRADLLAWHAARAHAE
jgi:hypothetical protein